MRIGRVGEALVLELVEQEGHALEAVAAVRVAGVGQEADHRLVDLHPLGRLRAIGRDRALGALGRDRPRPVRDQEPDQDLQGPRLGLGRLLAGHREEGEIGHGPALEALLARDAAERAPLVLSGRDRGADHHAVEAQIPGQRARGEPGDALAHQRPPGDRRRDRGQHRVAVQRRAEAFDELEEDRARAARADRPDHQLGAHVLVGRGREEQRARSPRRPRSARERSSRRAHRPGRTGRTGRSAHRCRRARARRASGR